MIMRKLSWIGIYIVMFVQIVKTFLKVVLSLAFAVIGFALSFHMLLENMVSLFNADIYVLCYIYVLSRNRFMNFWQFSYISLNILALDL